MKLYFLENEESAVFKEGSASDYIKKIKQNLSLNGEANNKQELSFNLSENNSVHQTSK